MFQSKIQCEIKKLVDECYRKMQECKYTLEVYTAKFIKAIKYAYNQWEKFTRLMEGGNAPLDNSEAERLYVTSKY